MTQIARFQPLATDLEALSAQEGRIVVPATSEGKLDQAGRKLNTLTRKALARVLDSAAFAKAAAGDVLTLAWPVGVAAEAVLVVKLDRKADAETCRRAGVNLAKASGEGAFLVLGGTRPRLDELVLGLVLRSYAFTDHKTGEADQAKPVEIRVMCDDPAALEAACAPQLARAEGVFFTRDLVNDPANILTTLDFTARLEAMQKIGLTVEVLDEAAMEELGMGALLSVGHGSASPSRTVILRWQGGGDEPPFALIGKGVVFDTGGISLKPASGMEEMTMDMGGAGVVAGAMRALALRKARANVVGIVGLVENMPSDRATRPGDVVTSMKGDTIEVINTDAEGRLVLADLLWYAQEHLKPSGMVNLATLTGAMIVALGNENAGLFSNDDALAGNLTKAGAAEGEGIWRLPMGKAYDDLIKSRIADMKNVGGRAAGSITAAQFLRRFVRDDMPWCHLDIAGVTLGSSETRYAPKGATGWGVLTLDRLIADRFEG